MSLVSLLRMLGWHLAVVALHSLFPLLATFDTITIYHIKQEVVHINGEDYFASRYTDGHMCAMTNIQVPEERAHQKGAK